MERGKNEHHFARVSRDLFLYGVRRDDQCRERALQPT
jgi:hypothetical protein